MHTLENKNQKGGINVADNKVIENPYKGLEIVDGHAVKAPEDYQDPDATAQIASLRNGVI